FAAPGLSRRQSPRRSLCRGVAVLGYRARLWESPVRPRAAPEAAGLAVAGTEQTVLRPGTATVGPVPARAWRAAGRNKVLREHLPLAAWEQACGSAGAWLPPLRLSCCVAGT